MLSPNPIDKQPLELCVIKSLNIRENVDLARECDWRTSCKPICLLHSAKINRLGEELECIPQKKKRVSNGRVVVEC